MADRDYKLQIVINAKDKASKVFKGLGGVAQIAFGTIIADAVGTATRSLVGFAKVSVSTASTFEDEMAILGIAARSAGVGVESLRDYALKMGADTMFSAQEAAEAMTGLFKAGMEAEEVMGDMTGETGALSASMALASASGMGLAEASDAIAVAMATFGYGAEDASRIVNSFVGAADASVAEVDELTMAMANVGPTAAAFGWSLEDVNIGLAVLSERGIRGSEAGTALKSMMTNLMRPTDDVIDTLELLGIALYDSEGHLKDLPTLIGELSTSMVELSDEERNLAVQTLAGTYGMKAMQTLLAEGVEGWEGMAEAIGDAATAEEIAEARMNTFSGVMESLQGSLETLMITVGRPLIDNFLRPLAEMVDDHIIPSIQEWAETTLPNLMEKLGGFMNLLDAVVRGDIGPGALKQYLLNLIPPDAAENAKSGLKTVLDAISKWLDENWPTIAAQLKTWGSKFWGWVEDDAVPQALVELDKISKEIRKWSEDPDTQAQLKAIGETAGGGLVTGLQALVGVAETWTPIMVEFTGALATAAGEAALPALKEIAKGLATGFVTGFSEALNIKLPESLKGAIARVGMLALPGGVGLGGGLPGFQFGGVVPGLVGQPRLAMVHGGETITPPGGRGGGGGGQMTIELLCPECLRRTMDERVNRLLERSSGPAWRR